MLSLTLYFTFIVKRKHFLLCISIRTLYNKCEADDETILLVKSSVGEVSKCHASVLY